MAHAHFTAETCTACEGDGWYYASGFPAYRKVKCVVCKGSGKMAKDAAGNWVPALVPTPA